MGTSTVLTFEEALSFTSEEVSKAVIHEEKSSVGDLEVGVGMPENMHFSEVVDTIYKTKEEKPSLFGSGEKFQSIFPIEESVCTSEFYVNESLSPEEQVRRLQTEILDLQKKRSDEGRANEKVVSIFASREQAWKAEKRRFLNEQKRLWQELQRSFMEQEVLKRRIQHLSGGQEGGLELVCEECEQREGWLNEMKERLREQEFVTMTSMEEAKAEQHEKNVIASKFAKLEADFCEANEKLRLESEAHVQYVQKHQSSLAELTESCKTLGVEKTLALCDIERLQKTVADVQQEKRQFEKLVAEMSTEIHMLQMGAHEKEEIISAMLKKADAETQQRHQLENELAILKARSLHAENEKEKWHMYANGGSPCIDWDLVKPRRSVGSKAESGFDNMRELQRLHDLEIRDLKAAFEEEVLLLNKRLSLFQERAADLEENLLLHTSWNAHFANNVKKKTSASVLEVNKGLSLLHGYVEEDITSEEVQLSIAKTLLRQYMETDAHREKEIEKLKKAYVASKAAMEILNKERSHTVTASSPRTRVLGDSLELERTRSKLEQRHLQEISAFERQLRARDQRMEAFRQQLLYMEREAEQRAVEVETLRMDLQRALEENSHLKKRD